MSKKSVRPATRRQAAADCINRALAKSDMAEICHAIGAATRLTWRRNLGLRGRAFIVRLQAIQ